MLVMKLIMLRSIRDYDFRRFCARTCIEYSYNASSSSFASFVFTIYSSYAVLNTVQCRWPLRKSAHNCSKKDESQFANHSVRHRLLKPPAVSKLSQLLADPCTSVRLPLCSGHDPARLTPVAQPWLPLPRLQRRPVRLQPNTHLNTAQERERER